MDGIGTSSNNVLIPFEFLLFIAIFFIDLMGEKVMLNSIDFLNTICVKLIKL